MLRRLATRIVIPALLVITMLVTAALPSSSQVPSVEDLVGEISQVEGLAPLDPVLNEVSNIVLTLLSTIDELLADVPLVNALALGGDDAVDAGVAFSQATFPDGAGTAILSREDLFADGFSSGGFQGVNDAPLLFTNSEDLDPRTGMELQRLGMDAITILGGETALHPLVVQKLQIAGLQVTRVGGPTRVETSVLAAQATNPAATTAVLTRAYPDAGQPDSQAYADLLAAGPYAAENGWPILMTPSDDLHPAVEQYLATGTFDGVGGGAINEVVIIGGTAAVSQSVEDQLEALGLTVRRVAGENRYATAVAIAGERGFTSSADADQLVIAESGSRDDVWAPGFAATAYGDGNSAPVLLTDGALIPIETLTFVLDGVVDNLLDGGPAVICASFVDSAACQAIALLMVGNLEGAIALITSLLETLETLPVLGDILAALGLADLLPAALQQLVDTLVDAGLDADALGSVMASLASGDAAVAQAALEEVAEGLGGTVDDLLGGDLVPEVPLDPDVVDGIGDAVDDIVGGGIVDVADDVVGGDVVDGGVVDDLTGGALGG